MMNLFNLSAKLTLDTQDYEKNINKTVDDAEKKGNSIGDKLKSVASTTAKVFTGMVAGASAAIGFLVKNSIEEYAQYEQLVGGVETLFKDSSNKVMEYANNAYKSAGLSANEYMDTITSFSASLLQGLGGDTAKAAEIGNKAVIDMSDNAAKMGTSMELIQNAYSGFSKQNYTMLDNLKLGFGGTKEEMQRLLAEAQKLTGIEYKIENFSDIIEAIHVIQTEIGITGTTEKEAAATIEGSLNMTKSAWKNLMTGIADSNADFDVLITNMVDSTSAFGENILPRIEIALNGIGKLIEKLLPPIAEKIPAILIDILPKVFEAGVTIVTKLIEGVITNLPNLANTIKGMINEFTPALNPIVEGIEMLITNIDKIAGAVVVATSAIVAFKAVSAIQGIVGMWQEAQLALALYSMSCQGASVAQGVMTGAFKASEIIVALFTGKLTLAELASIGFSKAQAVLNAVLSANPIGLVVAAIAGLIVWLVYLWNTNDGFRDAVTSAWNKILEVGKNVWNWISNFFTVSIPNAINTAINFFSQLPTKIGTFLSNSIAKMSQFVRDLGSKGLEAAKNLISNITSGLSGLPSKMFEIGKNIIQGMINGVKNMASKVVDSVKGVVNNAISGAKKLLGIHSPSRVFMEIGEYTSEGMAIGIEQNEDMVQKASENMVNTAIPDEIKVAETLNINRSAETSLINSLLSKLNNDKEIVLNIDGREFARATAEHMNNALNDYTNRYSFA